ncbi:hypothetical protein [Burkholderia gladioli]|uniref:hypothetical protein n=1 Tax=Burkholderia gladioli TaxID=28095 RepID=UPI00163EBD4A|nr:hypothetical protein [Burkholderia gladioli]
MAKSEDKTNRFFGRERLIGAFWTVAAAVILMLITHYFTARPAITSICSRAPINGSAYSDEYVKKLKAKIDRLNAKGAAADKFVRAWVVAGIGKDRGDQVVKGLIDAKNEYMEVSEPVLNDFMSTESLDSKISGEISCVVSNSGDTKASKIDISFPSQPVGLYVGGKSTDFDAQKPIYEIDSLNPQDSVTVVAQYSSYFAPEYASPPAITFAEGTAVTFMKASFIGFPSTVASFLSALRDTPIFIFLAMVFPIFTLSIPIIFSVAKSKLPVKKNKASVSQGKGDGGKSENKIARLGSMDFVVKKRRHKKRF